MKKALLLLLALILIFSFTACKDDEPPVQEEETAQESTPTPEEESTSDEAPMPEEESGDVLVGTGYDVGDTMYDFSVPTIDGGTFTLSENLGKPVFINLFATWCPPCVGEMPDIEQLYGEYGEEVTFIVIDVGEDAATAQGFTDDNGYTVPFAYEVNGIVLPDYNIDFIPQTFVLDANGTIVEFFAGGADYESFNAAIDKALEVSQ